MSSKDEVGLCECGCRQRTTISPCLRSSRGYLKGQPQRFIRGHRKRTVDPYRRVVSRAGVLTRIHRVRAEQALQKPLPVGAVVHHADGTTDDWSPLVVCQDQKYHLLLHARIRVKVAGGNPNTDAVCSRCGIQPRTAFGLSSRNVFGINFICRLCAAKKRELKRARGPA